MPASPHPPDPLLSASLLPTLLRFAAPNMLAMLATALAAIAETAYVGSFGTASLAGMALVFPLVMLQAMMSAGAMGGGVSSAVSRAFGAGEPARANALALHAMWIALAAGTAYMLLMLLLGPALFALLGGQGEALQQAVAYGNVAFLGSVFIWLVNTFSSVIRGSGNMRVPSATLLVVAVAQVMVPARWVWAGGRSRNWAWAAWRQARWWPMAWARPCCWPIWRRAGPACTCAGAAQDSSGRWRATSCAWADWPCCRRCKPC